MALLRCEFFSDVLGRSIEATLLLPGGYGAPAWELRRPQDLAVDRLPLGERTAR